jgi:uncharacterized coiled-coil DUF342 family protein
MAQVQPKYNRNQKDGFLAQFQQSLNTLNQLNGIIDKNTQDKTQFTVFVRQQLERIRVSIAQLIVRINELKTRLQNLQGQITQNNSGIQNKDAEIQQTKQQLEQLTRERDALTAQLAEATRNRDENANRLGALQANINQNETDLQNLNARNAELTNEINALRQDLGARGDVQAQHAQAIDQLRRENEAALNGQTQEHQQRILQLQEQINQRQAAIDANAQQIQQLQEQINQRQTALDANAQQIQQLQQDIVTRDQEITRLQNEGNQAAQGINQQLQQTTQELNNVQQTLQRIQIEKNNLIAENDDLIERIIAGTVAIQEATQRLRELTDENFYNQSRTGVTTDVDAIIQEIEGLIRDVSNSLQNGGPGGPSGNAGPRRFDENGRPLAGGVQGGPVRAPVRGILESIETGLPTSGFPQGPNASKKITIPGIREMTMGEFLNGIYKKANQANRPGNPSKYQKAYDSLQHNNDLKNNSLTADQITQIITDTLRSNGIEIKNGQLFGGKKTYKKYKNYNKMHNKSHNKHKRNTKKLKQRGGFLYGNKKTNASTASLTIPNKTPSTKTISTISTISSKTSSQKTNSNKNKNKKNKNTVRKR